MRSEAAFAALAGASPVDASSGRQQRHRLNRGGDRQLNAALYVIALNRKHTHPATRAYYERLAGGRQDEARGAALREARPCPALLPQLQAVGSLELGGVRVLTAIEASRIHRTEEIRTRGWRKCSRLRDGD